METKRQSERYQVNFAVRFSQAREFVQQYAENLSTGGVFVQDAHHLQPGEQVRVELDLPGYGAFVVTALVSHVMTPEMAEQAGRNPGAGLALRECPTGFTEAMRTYLLRLGKRRDYRIWAVDPQVVAMLEAGGYRAEEAPPPTGVVEAVGRLDLPLLGVVVPSPYLQAYGASLNEVGGAGLLVELNGTDQFDELLRLLDERLP
jgi:Tfp pilus assembly protein PilZ